MVNIQKKIINKENEYYNYILDICSDNFILEKQKTQLTIKDYHENKKILKNKFKQLINETYCEYEQFIRSNISIYYSYSYDLLLRYEKDVYLKIILSQNGFNTNIKMSDYLVTLIQPYLQDVLNLLLDDVEELIQYDNSLYSTIYNETEYYLLDYLKFRHNENYKLFIKNN